MKVIPESHQDLLKDETKAFVYLATVNSNGTPQVTPVWFDMDGDYVRINTATGRIKDRNMRARPNIALCIADPKNPYRYVQIRGKIVEFTTNGAEDHIDTLNFKYHGNRNYPAHNPEQPRVIFKVEPIKVEIHG